MKREYNKDLHKVIQIDEGRSSMTFLQPIIYDPLLIGILMLLELTKTVKQVKTTARKPT